MSEHSYDRTLIEGDGWDIAASVSKEIEAALPGKAFTAHLFDDDATFTFEDELSAGEVTTLDTVVADHIAASGARALQEAKVAKQRAIDDRTSELILAGFEFPPSSGLLFSASPEMQRTLQGLYAVRSHPAITYPVVWATTDNQETVDLEDADDVESFYLTGLGTIRAYKDSGTALKLTVKAATTIAEVDAVEDNR